MDCVTCKAPGVSMETRFQCPKCEAKTKRFLEAALECVFCGSGRVDWINRIDDDPVMGDMSFTECKNCNSNGPIVTGGAFSAIGFWNRARPINMPPNSKFWLHSMSPEKRGVNIHWEEERQIHTIEAPGAKPCPRCTSTDVRLFHLCETEEEGWFVCCRNCSGTGPIPDPGVLVTAPAAIRFWNDRRVFPTK